MNKWDLREHLKAQLRVVIDNEGGKYSAMDRQRAAQMLGQMAKDEQEAEDRQERQHRQEQRQRGSRRQWVDGNVRDAWAAYEQAQDHARSNRSQHREPEPQQFIYPNCKEMGVLKKGEDGVYRPAGQYVTYDEAP
jgi:hypothetical protein